MSGPRKSSRIAANQKGNAANAPVAAVAAAAAAPAPKAAPKRSSSKKKQPPKKQQHKAASRAASSSNTSKKTSSSSASKKRKRSSEADKRRKDKRKDKQRNKRRRKREAVSDSDESSAEPDSSSDDEESDDSSPTSESESSDEPSSSSDESSRARKRKRHSKRSDRVAKPHMPIHERRRARKQRKQRKRKHSDSSDEPESDPETTKLDFTKKRRLIASSAEERADNERKAQILADQLHIAELRQRVQRNRAAAAAVASRTVFDVHDSDNDPEYLRAAAKAASRDKTAPKRRGRKGARAFEAEHFEHLSEAGKITASDARTLADCPVLSQHSDATGAAPGASSNDDPVSLFPPAPDLAFLCRAAHLMSDTPDIPSSYETMSNIKNQLSRLGADQSRLARDAFVVVSAHKALFESIESKLTGAAASNFHARIEAAGGLPREVTHYAAFALPALVYTMLDSLPYFTRKNSSSQRGSHRGSSTGNSRGTSVGTSSANGAATPSGGTSSSDVRSSAGSADQATARIHTVRLTPAHATARPAKKTGGRTQAAGAARASTSKQGNPSSGMKVNKQYYSSEPATPPASPSEQTPSAEAQPHERALAALAHRPPIRLTHAALRALHRAVSQAKADGDADAEPGVARVCEHRLGDWVRRHVRASLERDTSTPADDTYPPKHDADALRRAAAPGLSSPSTRESSEEWIDSATALEEFLDTHGIPGESSGVNSLGLIVRDGVDPTLLFKMGLPFKGFKLRPKYAKLPASFRDDDAKAALADKELADLLDRGVVVQVPNKACPAPYLSLLLVERTKFTTGATKRRVVVAPDSVNTTTPPLECAYEGHSEALALLRQLCDAAPPGTPVCFAQIDAAQFYFSFEVAPAARRFFGFVWRGQRYLFIKMPQGLSLAPRLAQDLLAVPLFAALHEHGVPSAHFIDNVWLCGLSLAELNKDVERVRGVLERHGVPCPNDEDHLDPAAYTMCFLGVVYDGVNRRVRLEPRRKAALLKVLDEWSSTQPGTPIKMDDFERTVGVLSFVRSSTLPWCGPFLGPLYAELPESGARKRRRAGRRRHGGKQVGRQTKPVRWTDSLARSAFWIGESVKLCDGECRWFPEPPSARAYADACLGGVAFAASSFYQTRLNSDHDDQDENEQSANLNPEHVLSFPLTKEWYDTTNEANQTTLELLATTAALLLCNAPQKGTVRVRSDSTGALFALRSLSSPSPDMRGVLEWCALWLAFKEWRLQFEWVSSKANVALDVGSRVFDASEARHTTAAKRHSMGEHGCDRELPPPLVRELERAELPERALVKDVQHADTKGDIRIDTAFQCAPAGEPTPVFIIVPPRDPLSAALRSMLTLPPTHNHDSTDSALAFLQTFSRQLSERRALSAPPAP